MLLDTDATSEDGKEERNDEDPFSDLDSEDEAKLVDDCQQQVTYN